MGKSTRRLSVVRFKFFGISGVETGDTYQMAYAHNKEAFWSADSLYFPDDENGIGILAPYFDRVLGAFAYYGIQRVSLSEWGQIKTQCMAENAGNDSLADFFEAVEKWLEKGNRNADIFYILGV